MLQPEADQGQMVSQGHTETILRENGKLDILDEFYLLHSRYEEEILQFALIARTEGPNSLAYASGSVRKANWRPAQVVRTTGRSNSVDAFLT